MGNILTRKRKSFTLIEMMIVIVIIGLIVTIGVVVLDIPGMKWKINDNQRKKDVNEMAAAIEEFKQDHGHYPYINWGTSSSHAYSILGAGGAECKPDSYYDKANTVDFRFGTAIKFSSSSGQACDDLSLQLLGRAYLEKMPTNTTDNFWITDATHPGDSRLKKYIDKIPKDPIAGTIIGLNQNPPTAEYDTNPAGSFRAGYYYNSYYKCSTEGISPGDAYWLHTLLQQQKSGDEDSDTKILSYEIGTMNWFRTPKNLCDTAAIPPAGGVDTVTMLPDGDYGPTQTFDISGSCPGGHFDCVNESESNFDGSNTIGKAQSNTEYVEDTYSLADPVLLGTQQSASKISLRTNCSQGIAGAPHPPSVSATLYLGAINLGTKTLACSTNIGSWGTLVWQPQNGYDISGGQINNLRIYLRATNTGGQGEIGGGAIRIGAIYSIVDYTYQP